MHNVLRREFFYIYQNIFIDKDLSKSDGKLLTEALGKIMCQLKYKYKDLYIEFVEIFERIISKIELFYKPLKFYADYLECPYFKKN